MNKDEEKAKDQVEELKIKLDGDETPREVRHAFEEAVYRNVTAIKDFSETTRALQRKLEIEIETLRNQVTMYRNLTEEQTKQLSLVQAKLYQMGTE